MKTRNKIWLGAGAFALVQAVGVTAQPGGPTVTLTQAAKAADGTCGWERSREGRWVYDANCENGERMVRRGSNYYYSDRGERWNERGERYNERGGHRWNERGERWNERGQRWERREGWNNSRDRWGERG